MRTPKHFKTKKALLDKPLFEDLYEILTSTLCHGNLSQLAKILGISRVTADKYRLSTPPETQYWWNYILIKVIQDLSREMIQSRHKTHKQAGYRALSKLKDLIPRDQSILEVDPQSDNTARRHVLSLFRDYDQISSKMITTPKHSGGYSPSTLRRAINSLELDKETVGFGKDKITYYTLPSADEG